MANAQGTLDILGRVGFIGIGAVGGTLARALAERGANIVALAARHPEQAEALASSLPTRPAVGTPQDVAEASDLIFLAVPDDTITMLAATLPWRAGQRIIHFSGARGAGALAAVTARGAHPAALHPLMAFTRAPLDGAGALRHVSGCTWALEAEDAALRSALEQLVLALDGHIIHLAAEDRVPYHISGVLASNYIAALLGAAVPLWNTFGVSPEQALQALLPLLRSAVANLERVGLPQALSGPVARGDIGTVASHLAWLDEHAPADPRLAALREGYIALARLAIPLGLAKGTLSPEAAQALRALLPPEQA